MMTLIYCCWRRASDTPRKFGRRLRMFIDIQQVTFSGTMEFTPMWHFHFSQSPRVSSEKLRCKEGSVWFGARRYTEPNVLGYEGLSTQTSHLLVCLRFEKMHRKCLCKSIVSEVNITKQSFVLMEILVRLLFAFVCVGRGCIRSTRRLIYMFNYPSSSLDWSEEWNARHHKADVQFPKRNSVKIRGITKVRAEIELHVSCLLPHIF